MDAIHKGDVHMKPRWHFLLLSALWIIGSLILLLSLIFAVSLVVFFLRQSGAWFLPVFGGRGWFDFFRSLPWLLILLLGVFVLILEVLVRRYSFVYKKSLLTSIVGIVLVVLVGGFALAETPLHRLLATFDHHGQLPPPLLGMYQPPFRMRPDDVYRGTIIALTSKGFVLADRAQGTTSVIVLPHTRLPLGENFEVGETVVVIGDSTSTATGTVEAFGVSEADEDVPTGN
jgi:hypothetical protein